METLGQVALEPGTLVIGDLHLDVEDEEQVGRFARWLDSERGAPRLIVLGDLFEYWVGPAQIPAARAVLDALAGWTAGGAGLDVIPGNRDFLLERTFERRTGARLRRGGLVGRVELAGDGAQRVLFLHGDELCTLDLAYQRMRRVLRSPPVALVATHLPAPVARAAARRLRAASRNAVERKRGPEMELQADACDAQAARHACRTVVCGHAHRFRDERLDSGVRWLVVDAFGGARDTLRLGPQAGWSARGSRSGAR